jgi:hypothetical protein
MSASMAIGPTHDPQRGRLTGLGLGRGGEPGLVALVEMGTPLHAAAEDGDVQEVITLVEEWADEA